MNLPSPDFMFAQAFVLFFGIGLHEYAHCKFADLAGDPTPGYFGRVTLNLTKHFEMSGVIMMVITSLTGFGIGWGKPSPMNPSKMKNPRIDHFVAVIAGPISNVMQAIVYAGVLRLLLSGGARFDDPLGGHSTFPVLLCSLGVLTNCALAIFNMIPFGPLDGQWLLGLLLPEKPRHYWFQFNRQIGVPGLFVVIIALQYFQISILSGPILSSFHLLTGCQL
jgi:Zn-dependent protease